MPNPESDPRTPALKKSTYIAPIVIAAGVAATALAVSLGDVAPTVATQEPYDGDITARPPGAGTMPDGVADMSREGLTNGTVAADVVDQTQSADLVSPLLDGEAAEPVPSRSAQGLEPIDPAEGDIVRSIENAQGIDIAPRGSDS